MKWTAEKMHDHCAACSECAANAVEHALRTNADNAQSSYSDGLGEGATTLHWAKVVMTDGSEPDL